MTSVDWTTQMVDECEVRPRKKWPTTDQEQKTEKNIIPINSEQNVHSNCYYLFWIIKVANNLVFWISSSSYVIINVVISNGIGLTKKTWFLLARKDS